MLVPKPSHAHQRSFAQSRCSGIWWAAQQQPDTSPCRRVAQYFTIEESSRREHERYPEGHKADVCHEWQRQGEHCKLSEYAFAFAHGCNRIDHKPECIFKCAWPFYLNGPGRGRFYGHLTRCGVHACLVVTRLSGLASFRRRRSEVSFSWSSSEVFFAPPDMSSSPFVACFRAVNSDLRRITVRQKRHAELNDRHVESAGSYNITDVTPES